MLRFLTAGESHGPGLAGIIEGLPAGLALDTAAIDAELRRRQAGYGRSGRQHIEQDTVEVLAGTVDGLTIGAPLALRIANRDWLNVKDKPTPLQTVPRPGHADLSGAAKYGHANLRLVAERASARETAMRVAVGALAKSLLSQFGIAVGSMVTAIGGVAAGIAGAPWSELFARAEASDVRCPDDAAAEAMRRRIDEARRAKDTLGGVFVVAATGVPVGLGSYVHWDRRLDARLAAALMSIQAIKGVESGGGFALAGLPGTQASDSILPAGSMPGAASPLRPTNHAGGLEGGVSNGQPIVLRAAMKPIPTTPSPLPSVDMVSGEAAHSQYQRSDVTAVPAAAVVGEAMVAWVLAEALVEKLGGDSLAEMKRHADATWGRQHG